MRYPDAYSNILSELNPKMRSTLINRYGIEIEPKTQTELDMLPENLDYALEEDIKPNAIPIRECVQKMREALH